MIVLKTQAKANTHQLSNGSFSFDHYTVIDFLLISLGCQFKKCIKLIKIIFYMKVKNGDNIINF